MQTTTEGEKEQDSSPDTPQLLVPRAFLGLRAPPGYALAKNLSLGTLPRASLTF